jgi:hypothetical protein
MTLPLAPAHLKMLTEDSAIAPKVIAERGYYSVDTAQGYPQLKALGFPRAQAKWTPGLCLPLHTPDGQQPLTVYRPDQPYRDTKGDTHKYVLPTGVGVRIDCPPRCRAWIKDPAIPLWITEGQRKEDSLASRDAAVMGVLGVWSFKGKNPFGGVTVLADLDYIAFNAGREVRIVYDNDVMVNLKVRAALERLTEHLQRRGSHVRAVYLPHVDGVKVGVDDYLCQHTLQDLEALIEVPRTQSKATPATVELLDDSPLTMRRPLALMDGHAYAAMWPWVRITRTEVTTKAGEVVKLQVPEVSEEQRLALVREDGVIFGEQMDKPFAALGFEVTLPEIPATTKLWQTRSVKAYRQGERPEPKAVFLNTKTVIDRFLDFHRSLTTQDTMCEMVACYILATWFLDAFPVIGYLWPNGTKGSGKTKLLTVIAELAYLGQMLQAGGTLATLRDLADYGATLCFDDAENVMDVKKGDPDKRTLLLAGNRKGSWMTVKEPDSHGAWKTRYVQTFCPRLFSAIRLPDPVLASRTIIVPLIRTASPDKANADPMVARDWPFPRPPLINDLWALAVAHMTELDVHDEYVADHAPLMGRTLEPWRAILAVAHWLTGYGVTQLYDRMLALAQAYQTERIDLEPPDLTAWTIQALGACCTMCAPDTAPHGAEDELFASAPSAPSAPCAPCVEREPTWILTTDMITEEVKELLVSGQSDITPDSINSRRIGKILSALRLERMEREKRGAARKWRVTLGEIYRHFVTYGFTLPEQLFPKNAPDEQHGAHGAEPGDTPHPEKNDFDNTESRNTHGAHGAHGDMVHTSNGVAGPQNTLYCQHLELTAERFPDGSVLQRCRACRSLVTVARN